MVSITLSYVGKKYRKNKEICLAHWNKEWGEIWFLSSDSCHSVWIYKGSKHQIKMKTATFENGILWVSEDLLPLTAGGYSEEAFLGTLSHGVEFTGTHALNREMHTPVFRKCWGMMDTYPKG